MHYSKLLAAPLLAGLVVLGGLSAGQEKKGDQHAKAFDDCAKVCSDCQRECDSCAHHCAHLIAHGKKEHLKTLGSCADCADFCTAAARIVARHGLMAGSICEACAKACDLCEAECKQFSDDAHMKRCADACQRCATACREMQKHTTRPAAARGS